MTEIGKARIVVPAHISRGDVVRIQSIVQHPMDTGFFRDANASIIPPYFIQEVTISFGGAEIARFEWTSGISRDPVVTFMLRADTEGPLTMVWKDNKGGVYQSSVDIAFSTT
ncbi:MAG: thiosulfate oxidation carrier complex protein SoxZ [Gemmatimonadota bacterium]